MARRRSQPVQDAIRDVVRELLVAEQEIETPRNQRLTAERVHRLIRSPGHESRESVVRQVVRKPRLDSTAITGASRVEKLIENLGTMDLLAKVDDAVMEKIEAVLDNRGASARARRPHAPG